METAPVRSSSRLWLHLLLFVGTVLTTWSSVFAQAPLEGESLGPLGGGAWAFSFTLMAILTAHEMGHYVLARIHKVDATLPYFIPLPLLGAGTMGAVIRLRGRFPNRNALVDIGAAGPLAGLIVAMPLLYWGLSHSQVVDAPPPAPAFLGENSLFAVLRNLFEWIMAELTHAPSAPERASTGIQFGDNLLMQGLTWLAIGPLPEGKDVMVHPVVIAGWFGLFITLLNLMPVGQLDGGHLTFALWGRRAQWIGKGVALVLLLLILFVSWSWIVWLVVASKLVGFGHPEVLEPEVPLSRGRKWICALCFAALICHEVPLRFM
jgi:membrane-associated protease RseP (regulator of RpoE activity)